MNGIRISLGFTYLAPKFWRRSAGQTRYQLHGMQPLIVIRGCIVCIISGAQHVVVVAVACMNAAKFAASLGAAVIVVVYGASGGVGASASAGVGGARGRG